VRQAAFPGPLNQAEALSPAPPIDNTAAASGVIIDRFM